jgi:hypothetical protein
MTPAERLTSLLETLPAGERQEVTAWLLDGRPGPSPDRRWVTLSNSTPAALAHTSASVLEAGEGTQLVGIRLSTDRHAELREWCAEHGFTMAAVVRGLVDRFLEDQAARRSEGAEARR